MTKNELRQMIKEQLFILKQNIKMAYDKNGILTNIIDIQDINGAIQYNRYIMKVLNKEIQKKKNPLDREYLQRYQEDIKNLKKQLKIRQMIREQIIKTSRKSRRNLNEEKIYKLINQDNKSVKMFDFHGDTYKVIQVGKNDVIAIGPNGEEAIDIEEIIEQDEDIKGIK